MSGGSKSVVSPKSITARPATATTVQYLNGVERSSEAGRTPAMAEARKSHTAMPQTKSGMRKTRRKVSGSKKREPSASVNQKGPSMPRPHWRVASSPNPKSAPVAIPEKGAKVKSARKMATRVELSRAERATP